MTFGTGVHTCLGRDLDGGLIAKSGVDPASHQYGIITLLLRAWLEAGVARDPLQPPTMATFTARPNWGSYPVIFK
jgi:hypothetical protein